MAIPIFNPEELRNIILYFVSCTKRVPFGGRVTYRFKGLHYDNFEEKQLFIIVGTYKVYPKV